MHWTVKFQQTIFNNGWRVKVRQKIIFFRNSWIPVQITVKFLSANRTPQQNFANIHPQLSQKSRCQTDRRNDKHCWIHNLSLTQQAHSTPLISCDMTEQYSRNVTRRFVGCFAASTTVVSDFWPETRPQTTATLYIQLRHCDSIGQFKRLLKTHLFGVWDHGALWHLLGAPYINHLTYSLTYFSICSRKRMVNQVLQTWKSYHIPHSTTRV